MADARTADKIPAGQASRRPIVLAALMLSNLLAAMDGTIVATTIPAIVRDLGGFSIYTWIFSAYLLTQTVAVSFCGRLADRYGRKPTLLAGLVTFLAGSALCALAPSMPLLIVARVVQGVGAGLLQPAATIITGDLYRVEERARVQGWLASVWGFASLAGPLIGGLFSRPDSWPWIFWINIPIGLVALLFAVRFFKEDIDRPRERPPLDVAGGGFLVLASVFLLLGLQAGASQGWTSVASVGAAVGFAVFTVGFGFIERRAAEPALPMWTLTDRLFLGSNTSAAMVGVCTIGASTFLPTFGQYVLGLSPLSAGFLVGALSIGWPLSAAFAGLLYLRFGFRNVALAGAVVVVAAMAALVTIGTETPIALVALYSFGLGIGLGLLSTAMLVGAQSAVGWERRGIVTGTNVFFRMMGGAAGAAVFGAVSNTVLRQRLLHAPAALHGALPTSVNAITGRLESAAEHAGTASPVARYLVDALRDSTVTVFWVILGVCVGGTVIMLAIPRGDRPESANAPRPGGTPR